MNSQRWPGGAARREQFTRTNAAKKFPDDAERKAALQQQCHREDRLRKGYQLRRSQLLRQVVPTASQTGPDTPPPGRRQGSRMRHGPTTSPEGDRRSFRAPLDGLASRSPQLRIIAWS
jgi:hypothetical protein